ncbi:hypothetical protein DU500_07205 [Haloplanus rubicundus]|uniref:DUF7527 domain-containing protein n=1 Tax=Haloplanus rubicundus TaxID=1547898 RepID=A0A345E225_9EURY|nr:hypothetical protein [Haloplanus rubicundus]AXG06247.1 hypothetical protein DU500_07205 [Haloplanus rubicundus]
MDGEILDAVAEWGTRPVADGVSGLYELADGEFTGAVSDGTTWAFVLNGRFVGVFDGVVEDFEDASLTAYTAPDLSLPLLYAMQARGGEVRGQYYSNDTPLSELDDTLSSGKFVGYVELSENVLSGDYYVVYYGGRALPVAFVGNNRRLLSGDEAFERAADEVGIYSVVDADIEVVDLPERPEGAAASKSESDSTDESGVVIAPDADDEAATESEPATDADGGAASGDAAAASTVTDDEVTSKSASTTDADDAADGDGATEAVDDGAPSGGDDFESLGELSGVDDTEADTVESASPADTDDAEAETDHSSSDDVATDADATDEAVGGTEAEATSGDRDRLHRELDAARERIAELETERDRIAGERDDLRAEADRLRERVAELEEAVERLEAESADDAEASPDRTLDPDEALSGTNLFVRYADKADGTVERAAEGRISAAELRDNLRLEYHTEFESESVSVDGRPFEAFLRATPEHQFAEWLLTAVVYEIRQTDTRAELSKLYEAIENVDRIDLDGEVDVTVEDGESGAESTTVTFDVVFRDKMGDPLFAAAFDDSREPTRAGAIRSLVDGARSVSQAVEAFAAAFVVTTSFFDANAMEVAIDATRGGLFSRSSRKSYVKLSRKSGFHLCLVEARDEDFFLTVPEL